MEIPATGTKSSYHHILCSDAADLVFDGIFSSSEIQFHIVSEKRRYHKFNVPALPLSIKVPRQLGYCGNVCFKK